jgi:diguanylate cyclase (GGDEF)-like protein
LREFFQRLQASVEVDDLRRFARIIMDDLTHVLDGHEIVVRLLDTKEREAELEEDVRKALLTNRVWVEPETGRLQIPVLFQGKPLALVAATPLHGRALADGVITILPTVIRLSLEKLLLYKIYITDRETGLNNEDYFLTYLRKQLVAVNRPAQKRDGTPQPLSLSEKTSHDGLTVILVEVEDFQGLEATHGRLEAVRVLTSLADWMRMAHSGPSCLARLDRGRLGLCLPRIPLAEAAEIARRVSLQPAIDAQRGLPDMRLAFGLVAYPQDFVEDGAQGDEAQADTDDAAGLMLAKAELALEQALAQPDRSLFTFKDVLNLGGRVLEILPYNRVVVNLGRMMGAREGQVLRVFDADGNGEGDHKAEVVLFDVREDFSLGEVVNLQNSLSQAAPNDRLILIGKSPEDSLAGDTETPRRDQLLGIPDHQGFMTRLAELNQDQDQFAVLLIRVDGYDRYRTTMGHLESDRQFKALYAILQEDMPADCMTGRFSSDSLAVFHPGLDTNQAREIAEAWRDKIRKRLRQTASFGVAVFPCGRFTRADMVANAQKALEHASFLGPASVAVFDSVSLNISGDKLFEARDLDGAIADYKMGLELNPDDLNILNSLGVCYGYLEQPEQARQTFARVLELDPDNLMAHYNLGFALSLNQQPKDALESFRRASQIDPQNFEVLFNMGKMALELDMEEEALKAFQSAADVESRKTIVYRYLGQTLIRVGRRDEAEEAFKAAVRHDPEDAPSMSQLGVLFLEKGMDLEVALSLIRQSVDLDPTNPLFRQRLARALAMCGDLKEAEAQYRRALDMGVKSREVHFELGRVVLDQGREDEAVACFEAALKVDSEFQPAVEALAIIKQNQGDEPETEPESTSPTEES